MSQPNINEIRQRLPSSIDAILRHLREAKRGGEPVGQCGLIAAAEIIRARKNHNDPTR